MGKRSVCYFVFILGSLLFVSFISAITSANYNMTSTTISEGSVNSSSTNYKVDVAIESLSGNTSGSIYSSCVGFHCGSASSSGDIINPVVTIISPSNNTNSTDDKLDVNFSVMETSLDSCWYSNDSYTVNVSLANCVNITGVVWSKGPHNVSVYANDSSGNEGSEGVSFNISEEVVVSSVVSSGSSGGGGGGGGGGGTAVINRPGLRLDLRNVNVNMLYNEEKKFIVKATNIGFRRLEVSVGQKDLEGKVKFDKNSFSLEIGETKEVEMTFISGLESGIFTGRVLIGGQVIFVALNVRSAPLLFDVMVVVPDEFKRIKLGEKLDSQITLIPMGEDPRLDVTLNYVIKDFDGMTHVEESETILIEGQKSFRKEFFTSNLQAGKYVVGLEVVYPNGVATSSSHFEVVEEIPLNLKIMLGVLVAGILVAIALIIVMTRRYKKHKRYLRLGKSKKRVKK